MGAIEAIVGGAFVVLIVALIVTNPAGDKAVLSGVSDLSGNVLGQLGKGVK